MNQAPTPLRKGDLTRAHILSEALAIANRDGLQGLTIGGIADRCDMSKSGVFAHFGSREDLQIAVIQEYHRRFEANVFVPALAAKRGLPRLEALFNNWVNEVSHEINVGSIYISGAVEFDEREGSVRDALIHTVTTWHTALRKAVQMAIDLGDLTAHTQPEQLVYEMHGLILALHHDARFLRKSNSQTFAKNGFNRLIQFYLQHT